MDPAGQVDNRIFHRIFALETRHLSLRPEEVSIAYIGWIPKFFDFSCLASEDLRRLGSRDGLVVVAHITPREGPHITKVYYFHVLFNFNLESEVEEPWNPEECQELKAIHRMSTREAPQLPTLKVSSVNYRSDKMLCPEIPPTINEIPHWPVAGLEYNYSIAIIDIGKGHLNRQDI